MEDEIDLSDIFQVLWKRRLLIMGVFLAAVLVAGVISLTMPSVYKISSIITVGNFDDPVYATQASMKNVMLSDEFALDVFEQISPNATGSEFRTFKDSIKVETVKDSDKLIKISVETKNKQEGLMAIEKMISLYANRSEDSYNRQKKILSDKLAVTLESLQVIDLEINQTRETFPEIQDSVESSTVQGVQGEMQFSPTMDHLNALLTQRSALTDRSMELQEQLALIRNLEVVQPAREPVSPVSPRRALIVAIGGITGLMIGIFAAFLLEWQGRPAG